MNHQTCNAYAAEIYHRLGNPGIDIHPAKATPVPVYFTKRQVLPKLYLLYFLVNMLNGYCMYYWK